jgi:hypothetical protein
LLASNGFAQSHQSRDKLPLRRALLWVFLSVILVSGSAAFSWFYYQHLLDKRATNDDYLLTAIVQTGPVKDALQTVYLAELLELSADRPTNLFQLDLHKAEKQLLASPVIKTAKVKRVPPNTLYIDYTVRQPIAMLYDYVNSAIDEEGYIFPIHPFFAPKRLPEVYVGLPPPGEGSAASQWNVPIKGAEMQLALSLFSMLHEPMYRDQFRLLRIDVANAYADSYGRREIVLIIEDQLSFASKEQMTTLLFPRILRLSPERYREELKNYLTLREILAEKALKKHQDADAMQPAEKMRGLIIDLRVPKLAFLKE